MGAGPAGVQTHRRADLYTRPEERQYKTMSTPVLLRTVSEEFSALKGSLHPGDLGTAAVGDENTSENVKVETNDLFYIQRSKGASLIIQIWGIHSLSTDNYNFFPSAAVLDSVYIQSCLRMFHERLVGE